MTNGILTDSDLATMLPVITISNHPSPNVSLARKAQFLSNFASLELKIIRLKLLVTHYTLAGAYTIDPLPDTVFYVTADTLHWVDPTQPGVPRIDGDNTTNPNAVREFDFWWNLLYNTNTQTQAELYQLQVAAMDEASLFDIYPTITYIQN